jgi:signal transduction histidine kinase
MPPEVFEGLRGNRSRKRGDARSRVEDLDALEAVFLTPNGCRVGDPLAQRREQQAILAPPSTAGMWRWDPATNQVWASKYARSLLGLGQTTPLVLETLFGAAHPVDRAVALRAVTEIEASNEVPLGLRVLGSNGETRCVVVTACTLDEQDPAPRNVVGYVVDDSERRRTEVLIAGQQQQIRHLTRVAMLGELSGALAHELQQPLTAILCNAVAAQILVDGPGIKAEEFRDVLQAIIRDDRHAGEIIHHLRALMIRRETQFQRIGISDLIDGVMALSRSTLKKYDVRLDLRIKHDVPYMLGDRVELQQVILNLVLNGCESMTANSSGDRTLKIVAAGYFRQGVVRISVIDCGTGIIPDRLERVFDPFFTTKEGGLGLGLTVCRSIIDAHKGRLWATNRAPRGAAFHFTLPIMATEGTS